MAFPSDSVRTKDWGTEILTDADLEGQFDVIHTYITAALNSSTGHAHTGSSNQGPKLSALASLTFGASQAQGDILYASSASALARLGAGTSGQFLKTQGAGANPTWADVVAAATQAEMETATSTTTYVSPGRTQYHPGVAKAWALFNGTGTPAHVVKHNIDTSITDNGTGDYTVAITTDFSSANFVVVGTGSTITTVTDTIIVPHTLAAGTIRISVRDNGSNVDRDWIAIAAYGDQA